MTHPAVRQACFARDQWKCRHCNNRNGLHPHHIIYRSHGGLDVLNNLVTLCWICHDAHHRGFLGITVLEFIDHNLVIKFTRKKNWKP